MKITGKTIVKIHTYIYREDGKNHKKLVIFFENSEKYEVFYREKSNTAALAGQTVLSVAESPQDLFISTERGVFYCEKDV